MTRLAPLASTLAIAGFLVGSSPAEADSLTLQADFSNSAAQATVVASGTASANPSDPQSADSAWLGDGVDVYVQAPGSLCAASESEENYQPTLGEMAPAYASAFGNYTQTLTIALDPGQPSGDYVFCGYLTADFVNLSTAGDDYIDEATNSTTAIFNSVPSGVSTPAPPSSPTSAPSGGGKSGGPTKPKTPGGLRNFGAASRSIPVTRLYAFAARCNALPCHIRLTEQAFASGRRVPRLDRTGGPRITMSKNARSGTAWAVWFKHSDINPKLLAAEVKQHRRITLHVRATLTDRYGSSISATRKITLKSRAAPKSPARAKPPTLVSLACQQARLDLLNARKDLLWVISTGGDVQQAELTVKWAKVVVKADCSAKRSRHH